MCECPDVFDCHPFNQIYEFIHEQDITNHNRIYAATHCLSEKLNALVSWCKFNHACKEVIHSKIRDIWNEITFLEERVQSVYH